MAKKSTTKKPTKAKTPVQEKNTAPSWPGHDSVYEAEYAFQTHYRDEQQRAGHHWPH